MIPVYCHMDNNGLGENGECEGGGWTLVMKTDGTKVNSIETSQLHIIKSIRRHVNYKKKYHK